MLNRQEISLIRSFLDRVGDGTRPIRGIREAEQMTRMMLILAREEREFAKHEGNAAVRRSLEPQEAD